MKNIILLLIIALSSVACKTSTLPIKGRFEYNRVKKNGGARVAKYFVARYRNSDKLVCSVSRSALRIRVSKRFNTLLGCLKKRDALNKHRLERLRIKRAKKIRRIFRK